jgi:hypothetical protein
VKNKAAKKAETKAKPPQAKPPQAKPPQSEPAQPLSREQIYDELNRRVVTLLGTHKKCSAPICKRLRRCADPGYQCERDFPQPPLTAAEDAAVTFRIRKALDAEIARRKALGQWRGG